MKTFPLIILAAILFIAESSAQYIQFVKYNGAVGEEDWTRMWTHYKPNNVEYFTPNIILSGIISKNITLLKKNTYLLRGVVYVTDNAVLTIEPGTIIRGDYITCGTLVISKGCKINASGSETDPIIFTSNKPAGSRNPGDWGGVVILGNAQINKIGGVAILDGDFDPKYVNYGGDNDEDDSGVMKYVRIEYPGHKISKTVELNGLTLAAVGKKTSIENIQVSCSNDDSFEMFGGAVYLRNLISYKCTDDDFDFNFGYNGRLQFAIAIRHPLIADYSGSRCIEADSYSGGKSTMDPARKFTNCSISNLTLVSLDPINGLPSASREAIYIGKDCYVSVYNSIISGFKYGFVFKDDNMKDKALKSEIRISGNQFNDCVKMFLVEKDYDDVHAYYYNSAFKNQKTDLPLSEILSDPANLNHPDYRSKIKDISEHKF
jgi:hypothetical protein